jgi:hypothetical protein
MQAKDEGRSSGGSQMCPPNLHRGFSMLALADVTTDP